MGNHRGRECPNCIKVLVKIVEGNPSTIIVYKNDAGEAEAVAHIEDAFKESFEAQGWDVEESRILNLNGMAVYILQVQMKAERL